MVDVMSTEVGTVLRRARMLSEAVAWYEVMDPDTIRQILNLIQKDQLMDQGIDATGEVIGYYSWTTHRLTNGRKEFNTHYTLYDTGEFFRQMFVVVLRDAFVVDSDGADKGEDNLFEKYGEDIVGLTDGNMDKLKEVLRPKYIQAARKGLGID
jgi:hypothetical protein